MGLTNVNQNNSAAFELFKERVLKSEIKNLNETFN